jgi:hypothetical protein
MIVVFKKMIVILLAGVMLLSPGGCGAKKKLSEKVAEKVTEGIIEKATGGEVKLDINKDKVTVKGKDGEVLSFGENEWPKGQAADLIPEFKKGKIITTMNSDEGCAVLLEGVDESDFQQYVEALKNAGFTNNMTEIQDEKEMGFYGSTEEGALVSIYYSANDGMMNLNVQVQ